MYKEDEKLSRSECTGGKSAVSDTSVDIGAVLEVRDYGDDKLKVSLEHCYIAHMFNSVTN